MHGDDHSSGRLKGGVSTPEPLAALLAGGPGSSPALVCPDDGETLTYDALRERVGVLASQLAGLGVGRGDRVALVVPNGPEIVQLTLAIADAGAAAAPLNPAYTRDEFAYYLEDLAPRVVLVGEGGPAAVREAAGGVEIAEVLAAPGRAVELRPARGRRVRRRSRPAARRRSRSFSTRAGRRAARSRCRCCSGTWPRRLARSAGTTGSDRTTSPAS